MGQEELGSLLHFPGHGYLPNTVQTQIVEILFQLSSYPNENMIIFERNSEQIKMALHYVYHLLGTLVPWFGEFSTKSFFRQWNEDGLCPVQNYLNYMGFCFESAFLLSRDLLVPEFVMEVDHCRALVREIMKRDKFL